MSFDGRHYQNPGQNVLGVCMLGLVTERETMSILWGSKVFARL